MSLLAISLTIQQRISDPLAKFLLLLLADRHNGDTGACFPKVERLCEDSGISRRSVFRKLDWLETEGFISREERRRPDGSQASTNYTLTYVPSLVEQGRDKPLPKRQPTKALPPMDWRPSDAVIERLRGRYPHHETSDETFEYLIGEWLNYCHASGSRYIQFDAAFANSAERYFRRQSAKPATGPGSGGQRSRAGSLSGALRRIAAR